MNFGHQEQLNFDRFSTFLNNIKFLFHHFSLRLNSFTARKTRDTLVKSIYKHLFGFIMSSINDTLMSNSKQNQKLNTNISILDIAGFGNIAYLLICFICQNWSYVFHRMFWSTDESIRAIMHQLCKWENSEIFYPSTHFRRTGMVQDRRHRSTWNFISRKW